MTHPLRSGYHALLWLAGLLATPQLLRAQGCLLVPVPLVQRTQQAALVVEARVTSAQAERAPNGHIVTRHQLEVYKVFRGRLPTGPLSVRTPGGFLGERGEVVSGSPTLQTGQQGVFFLEADPTQPGELRPYAGPQGFIQYDLATLTASEPFGRYASIEGTLYGTLAAQAGTKYRLVAANAGLAAATQRLAQRPRTVTALGTTAPTISGFAPSAVTAGTSTSIDASPAGVLTISGAGFGPAQGAGYVQFRNADNPGPNTAPNYTQPLASDYLSWSDTQIQVRVPSYSTTGNAAGTGNFQVFEDGGTSATSPSALTVTYNVITTSYNNAGGVQTYRIHLANMDGNGGYVLHYSPSFAAAAGATATSAAPPDAPAAFETALQTWQCNTNMTRTIGEATTIDATAADQLSVVRFAAANELPTGVLGVTYSYHGGCGATSTSVTNWLLTETDYVFAPVPYPGYTWNFTNSTTSFSQFDFQSVVLHELGHGEQLGHIISPTGVMNWSVSNGSTKRTLDASTDVAAAQDIIRYSTSATANGRCGFSAFTTSTCPLPVVLTAFDARYQPGQGTRLSWATASETGSLAFVVESQDDPAAGPWQQVARVAATGSSPTPHQYATFDARPLAGTRYYRLRQLDRDGRVAYSPVVTVAAAAETAALAAYPNPAAGLVRLSGPLAAGRTAQVRLLDATGRCQLRTSGPADQAAFDLPLAGVPAGLYVVEWDGGAGRGYQRLQVIF
ncbi:MAG: hypothetical protein ACRYG7_38520 [Janthinobacterium lividum]